MAGFALRDGQYQPLAPDTEGRLVSGQLGLSLARWEGKYQGVEAQWLRWATLDGQVLPTPEEVAEQESQRAEREHERAGQERQRAERLAAKLRELGIDPDTLK